MPFFIVKLSIIIPTHNREENLAYSAASLLLENSEEFEIILALNSDSDREAELPISLRTDKRVKILKNPPRPLSMQENWERSVNAATCEWITVIGDDDFLFLDLIEFLYLIEQQKENIEAIGWNKILFNWPEIRLSAKFEGIHVPARDPTSISLETDLKRVPSKNMLISVLQWDSKQRTPGCGVSIYHGALKRSLIERLKNKYKSHFVDPIVDFDIGHRVLLETDNVYWSQRPFSIMGASKKSNSAGVNHRKEHLKRTADFWSKNSLGDSNYQYISDSCGLVATVYNFQKRFCALNGISWDLPYSKLREKIETDCLFEISTSGCSEKATCYDAELNRLFPDIHPKGSLNPIWQEKPGSDFQGLTAERELVVDASHFENIYEFARFCKKILCGINFIGRKVGFKLV
jgi:glycosyltransferase involved in cell wall biosynthesis